MRALLLAAALLAALCCAAQAQDIMEIEVGTTVSGLLSEEPAWDYWSFMVDMENATQAFQATLSFPSTGSAFLYARMAQVPSAAQCDYRSEIATPGATSQSLTIYSCSGGGMWVIGVYATTTPVAYTLTLREIKPTFVTVTDNSPATVTVPGWGISYVSFMVPMNNSFITVSASNPNPGTSGLLLRPMMCPTLFQYTKADLSTGQQTAPITCTEVMGGMWFAAVVSTTSAPVTITLTTQSQPYSTLVSGVAQSSSLALNAWNNYVYTTTGPRTLSLTLTTTGGYDTVPIYFNSGSCGDSETYSFVGGLLSRSATATTVTQKFPADVGTWYLGVTTTSDPSVGYSLAVTDAPIVCSIPTAATAPFCAGTANWYVGDYVSVTTADSAASNAAASASLVAGAADDCPDVVNSFQCSIRLPMCNVNGLPARTCASLCQRYNACTGSRVNCADTTRFVSSASCTSPARYASSGVALAPSVGLGFAATAAALAFALL